MTGRSDQAILLNTHELGEADLIGPRRRAEQSHLDGGDGVRPGQEEIDTLLGHGEFVVIALGALRDVPGSGGATRGSDGER